MLAQRMINDRYQRVMEWKPWAALRATSQFLIPDAYTTGTVAVVYGSNQVTGTNTVWTSAMVGLQFKANGQAPILTITAVDVGGQVLTVDAVWGLTSASAATYMILKNYVTVPTDFKRFVVVADPLRQWRLRFNIKSSELNLFDPGRTNVGDPWVLADLSYDTSGVPQYELWPGPQTKRVYPYVYIKEAAALVQDTDRPIYPFRGEELVLGALADLCQWPGTADAPNPLFRASATNLPMFEARFMSAMNNIERQDEEIYLNSWGQDDNSTYPFYPGDAKFMQNHAFAAI